jgi:hypothetical protein
MSGETRNDRYKIEGKSAGGGIDIKVFCGEDNMKGLDREQRVELGKDLREYVTELMEKFPLSRVVIDART